MRNPTRRAFFPLAGAAMLAGCNAVTTTTVNGVTTITLDVAKINAYAEAANNFGQAVLVAPGISTLIAPYAGVIATVEGAVMTDIAAFNAAASGKVTLTYNATSIPASVHSLLTDFQSLAATVQKALPHTAIVGTVAADINAFASIINLFEIMIGVSGARLHRYSATLTGVPLMSEAEALRTLGVVIPPAR